MAAFRKYAFRKYSHEYPKMFRLEKARIKRFFPYADIEHIGSTAVPNLGGKGIIDIAISVPKNKASRTSLVLQQAGYEFRSKGGDKERKFFQRSIKQNGRERRIHVHLTDSNSKSWKKAIALRDYLRKHAEAAIEYAKIKKEAAAHAKGSGKRYMKHKKEFLRKLNMKAMAWLR